LAGVVKTKVEPASGTIEVKVIHTNKEDARDLAAGLVKALETYESDLSVKEFANRMIAAQRLLQEAEDDEESKRKFLANLISVRGEAPEEPAARLDLDAARKDWQNAQDRVVEREAKLRANAEESRVQRTWVELLSQAQISDTPVKIAADETMPGVILRSLGTGLGCALVIPYLLELLFPRVRKTKKLPPPVRFEEPLLGNATAGG
jgi:capsular polysaccharide biosynthesis protein